MSNLTVDIFRFKNKDFTKRYGIRTKAVATPCRPKKKVCEIHIRKSLAPKNFKRTVTHEIGHLVTEKARVASKISQKERESLRRWSRGYLSEERGKVPKGEQIKEMLAVIYQSKKLKNKSRNEFIQKNFPKTSGIINEAIKRIKIRKKHFNA